MYRWYVINTYSGHENKVKHNLEHRVQTMSQNRNVRQVVVPTEQVMELNKDGQKEPKEKRTMPGYVLVNMDLNEDSWQLVKGTPGVTHIDLDSVAPDGRPVDAEERAQLKRDREESRRKKAAGELGRSAGRVPRQNLALGTGVSV